MNKANASKSKIVGVLLAIAIVLLLLGSGKINASTISSLKSGIEGSFNAPIFAASSNGYGYGNITTTTSTTTISQANFGGTGGGAAAPAGGSSLPIVNTTSNGFIITNLAQLDNVNLVFCGQIVKLTDNYITPNSTGITINSYQYTLDLNASQQLNLGKNCYVELTSVSYLPIQQTVTLQLYNTSTINTTALLNALIANGISLHLSPLGLISNVSPSEVAPLLNVTNVNSSSPLPPSNFIKLGAFNVTLSNTLNPTALVINATVKCGYSTVAPFILINDTWKPINPSLYNSTACTVTFVMPSDPIVAFMAPTITAPRQVPATSSIATTTIATTTIAAAQPPSNNGLVLKIIVIFIAVVIAIMIIISLLASMPKKKKGNGKKKRPMFSLKVTLG